MARPLSRRYYPLGFGLALCIFCKDRNARDFFIYSPAYGGQVKQETQNVFLPHPCLSAGFEQLFTFRHPDRQHIFADHTVFHRLSAHQTFVF